MKVTIIEGSPEELAEYEARTGVIGQAREIETHSDEQSLLAGNGNPIAGGEPVDDVVLRAFIFSRARILAIGELVEAYVRRVLDLGDTVVEKGTSKSSKDGFADYLLVYDAGPRRYGAVSYVNAKNGGLTLRLTRDDVSDVTERVVLREVEARNEYQINCPLKGTASLDLALMLTQRALKKIR